MGAPSSRFRNRFLGPACLGVLLAVSQPACHVIQKVEGKSEPEHAAQPGMFTLTADQSSHLKTAVVDRKSVV